MLAKMSDTPRVSRQPASSLTSIVGTPPGACSLLQGGAVGQSMKRLKLMASSLASQAPTVARGVCMTCEQPRQLWEPDCWRWRWVSR
jgi:hypothetical protein